MELITEEYSRLNADLHNSNLKYGTSGGKWAGPVKELAVALGTRDILDYGCGKGTLSQNIPFKIKQYDPAIPLKATHPRPADIVVCTDVMEHIEPDLLDNVLDHIQDLTKKAAFFVVATRPAVKTLADGRNAHLTVEPIDWWLPKFWARFNLLNFQNMEGEFLLVVEAK